MISRAPCWRILVAVLALNATCLCAAVFTEDFSTDPPAREWQVFGDSSLFVYDAAEQNLKVTWDSAKPNSYYWLPLGTIGHRQDDISIALDLTLTDLIAGVNSNKPSTFQLAFGFL